MSVIDEIAKLLATAEPPELGTGPRAGVQPAAPLTRTLDDLFRRNKLPHQRQQLIRALILLWHDHLDAAHVISQDIEGADGSFVHGIVHRREPDYSNARYWFHRVGNHAAFPEIASRVSDLLAGPTGTELRAKLVPSGEWNALAFIAACERGNRPGASGEDKRLLREIQAIESRTLLEWFGGEADGK